MNVSLSHAFRLVPKLNYRAKFDFKSIQREEKQRTDNAKFMEITSKKREGPQNAMKLNKGKFASNAEAEISRLKQKMDNEMRVNEQLLARVRNGELPQRLKYGDIVQLECAAAESLFLAMKSSPAHSNGNNRRVTLKRGGISCYFKLMPPRESLRVAGSLLYSNDEAILESVKFEGFALAASSLYAAADSGLYSPLRNRPSGETRADAFDELPPAQQRQCRLELNGAATRRGGLGSGEPVVVRDRNRTHFSLSLVGHFSSRSERGWLSLLRCVALLP